MKVQTNSRVFVVRGANIGVFPTRDRNWFDVLMNDDGSDRSWRNPRYDAPLYAGSESELIDKLTAKYGHRGEVRKVGQFPQWD